MKLEQELAVEGIRLSLSEDRMPEFAVVDDSPLVLRSWVRESKGQAIVHSYYSPEEFLNAIRSEPEFATRLEFIVTDFHFGQTSGTNGFEFANTLKQTFAKPILLSTDGNFSDPDFDTVFSRVIEKVPLPYLNLKSLVGTGS